ncbi:MAG: hypothetical protein HYR62_10430 [Actinobacteria bacterium]|nr:hypothetical protein [Actinomycetota bacterium]MBI3686340.1 hypothetical protein [Actinomycetota bacterium]
MTGHDASRAEHPTAPADQPRAIVLGTFAAVDVGVLAAAAAWRRRRPYPLPRHLDGAPARSGGSR